MSLRVRFPGIASLYPASSGVTDTPGTGTLAVEGKAPLGVVTHAVGLGTISLEGLAPTQPQTHGVGTGAVSLAGLAPGQTVVQAAGLGTLELAGFAPSSNVPTVGLPGTGTLSVAGYAPTGLGTPVTATVGLGTLSVEGYAPTSPLPKTGTNNPDLLPPSPAAYGTWKPWAEALFKYLKLKGERTRRVRDGYGTPENIVAAPVGTLYVRLDGGTGTTLYVKESGTGRTGWVAK